MSKRRVAKTIETITEKPEMKTILDRRSTAGDIAAVCDNVLGWWSYDLYTRKLGPASDEGTELDLAALLSALVDRGAVVILPTYKASTPRTKTEGEHVVSAEQRHGKLTAVLANTETFKFSVRIFDANVVTTDSVGKHRTFNITNERGAWYDGWTDLQFLPTAKENSFLTEQFTEQAGVAFKHFVAKGRWTSFFGQYYIIAKALVQRLVEENAYWRSAIKDMLQEGIRHPGHGGASLRSTGRWYHARGVKRARRGAVTEAGQKKTVTCFEAEVDVPFQNEYGKVVENEATLVALETHLRSRTQMLERLRFLTRATEFAYDRQIEAKAFAAGLPGLPGRHLHVVEDWWPGTAFPSWLQGVAWEDYKKPRSKTVWQRLELTDEVALRMRLVDRKITVK